MHYAHTATLPGSRETNPDHTTWEPLFTPFGEIDPSDPTKACSGKNGAHCPHCENLEPTHGHLNKVAHLASQFAAAMFPQGPNRDAAQQWAYIAGLWHDLGKFAPEWQAYLASKADPHTADISGKVPHSTSGAQYAYSTINEFGFGTLLAYLIAGHHAGLANGTESSDSCLSKRLNKPVPHYLDQVPKEILEYPSRLPPILSVLASGYSLGTFIRFLFSALVDADFLATEAFMAPDRAGQRNTEQPSIRELEFVLNSHLGKLTSRSKTTPVNVARSEVLTTCLLAADRPPGLFSLTVPTGGGKTLSSLAFALKHARLHDLRRVIYVIPYTSIIEQNAAVFRKALTALGPDVVLEHHSNLDPDAGETTTSRLATENWDARLIVTTNVQFYESLHANRTSRCRKIHRLARSVIILDEAQSLPIEFLNPCLRSLEELTKNYHSSVVLCTATQPAINRSEDFKIGLDSPHEIIPNPRRLFQKLCRVQATRLSGKTTDAALLEHLNNHPQALCIVNTRRHARELYEALPNDGSRFHLSALMCPAHRHVILSLVKRRLLTNQPIRLISTQLIEAGVDIDFPVVFRSMAGLDSIAQAAGRCDREGLLTEASGHPAGQLIIFDPAEITPPPFIKNAANSTIQTFATNPPDLLGLDAIQDYFQRHYWENNRATDAKNILENYPRDFTKLSQLFNFQFKKCAADFRLIDDYTEPILIPFGKKGRALCDKLRETFDPAEIRILARKLQRYTVAIPKEQHSRLVSAGILLSLHDDRYFLLNSDPHYSQEFGLHPEPDLSFSAQNSIL